MSVKDAVYACCLEVGTLIKSNETEVDGMNVVKEVWNLNGKSYRFILVNGSVVDKRRFA